MNIKLLLILVTALFCIIAGCDANAENQEAEEQKIDLISDQFPEAQAEIKEVLDGIFQSFVDKDADKLISYHVYGPKFTEFKDSLPRTDSVANEQQERGLIAAISAWEHDVNDLKINVFGEVAVVTFHADFRPTIGDEMMQILGQVTLVFVNTDLGWKITHEHLSPLNVG